MSARLQYIIQMRALLVARSDLQREQIAEIARQWRAPLALLDTGIGLLKTAARQPALIVLGVALLTRTRSMPLAAWLRRGALAWQMYCLLRTILRSCGRDRSGVATRR